MKQLGDLSDTSWLSIRRVGGAWVDWYNHSLAIQKPAWMKGHPSDGNCAMYSAGIDAWMSWYCNTFGDSVATCTCNFPRRPTLFLRGLCKDSNLDQIFIPQNHLGHGNTFHYGIFKIEVDFSSNIWRMHVFNSPTVARTDEADASSMALGKYNWMIDNDNIGCNKGKAYSRLLKLTGCREGSSPAVAVNVSPWSRGVTRYLTAGISQMRRAAQFW